MIQNKVQGYKCECGGTTFTDCSYKKENGLPYVHGLMCVKCGRTYFNQEQSIAYQKAKNKTTNKKKKPNVKRTTNNDKRLLYNNQKMS